MELYKIFWENYQDLPEFFIDSKELENFICQKVNEKKEFKNSFFMTFYNQYNNSLETHILDTKMSIENSLNIFFRVSCSNKQSYLLNLIKIYSFEKDLTDKASKPYYISVKI